MDNNSSDFKTTQNLFTRYGMTTYLVLGNTGLFFNLNIFSQTAHRRNSSSLYLLAITICNFFCLNFDTIPWIYALDHVDLLTTSLIMCKLQFYFRHAPYQMVRSFMILACINRYISSSVQHRFRSFNQYRITFRCIVFIIIFWLLVCLYIPFLATIGNGICDMIDALYALIYSIYLLIFAAILPPMTMTISSLLIVYNLKKIRTRVQPFGMPSRNSLVRKRDRDYIRMLLVEIMIYVITTFPFALVVFYTTIIQLETIIDNYKPWQIFLIYLTRSFLVYLNTSLSFWIYITLSKTFRSDFKELISKWYLFIKNIKQ